MTVPRLVGMIHLPALPGAASWEGTPLTAVGDAACADAEVLATAGFDAVLVQNSLDRPTRERVDALAIAQLTAIVARVRATVDRPVGVNIVKNDGPGAVAVAAATGAAFVRVKVLTGAVLSAEGVLTGCAEETHRTRDRSGARPQIWADVYEPTSRPLRSEDFDVAVMDALDFGLADAVIVTGTDTAGTLDLARRVRNRQPEAPVVIGGRIDAATVAEALALVDGVIVGSALKVVPGIRGRVDAGAAKAIVAAAGMRS
jgi:membrane complex biogenesis BtpA family protein